MALHTKQPEVLRELFAALGNDPYVIAECLARPILAGLLVAEREGGPAASRTMAAKAKGQELLIASQLDLPSSRGLLNPPSMSIQTQRSNAAYKLPEISVPLDCMADTLIGGIIILGDTDTDVLVRAIGPALTAFGVSGALEDPTFELHDKDEATIVSNDDWKETQ